MFHFHLPSLHFFEHLSLLLPAQDPTLSVDVVDVAGDGEVVHENVVKSFMVGIEDHDEQVGALHKGRGEGVAGLLDGYVIVFAICAGKCGCGGALTLDCFVRVRVDVVDIVQTCPFAAFLELEGGSPGEGQGVASHVAVSDCANHAIPDFLAADGVRRRLCKSGSDKKKCDQQLHSYLANNWIINLAIVAVVYSHHILQHKFSHIPYSDNFTAPIIIPNSRSRILHYTNLTYMLSLRKAPSFTNDQVQKSDNGVVGWARLILPPFIVYTCICIAQSVKRFVQMVRGLGDSDEIEEGEISKEFNRRRYEEHLENMKITQEELGWTNQVLYQQNKKAVNYYLPVFITNKIKSIQDISVQSLTGNISCALIINVCFEGLPEEIVKKLESAIIIQLNRGEAIKLQDDGITITVKRDKKANFLIFTIRKLFLAFLLEDTLWSPFELVELIISITLNTVSIPPHSLQKIDEKSAYNPDKEYKISFNCMRNSDKIPISYALDCVFGVYDLAEKKLESYHSRFGTISEIQKNFEEYEHRQKNRRREERALARCKSGKEGAKKEDKKAEKQDIKKAKTEKDIKDKQPSILEVVAQSTMKRLSIRPSTEIIKKPSPKVKYFQYTHFVIPLYKYPGNSLATIFIPIFLLALVSLAIFFQQPQLSGRIGAIATMILGYIALIPSIKEQLPPSSKLTVIESVVYIETMCCLLCLYESFTIDGEHQYKFIWNDNITFLLCLGTHISTFIFVIGLYAIHKLKWEPDYNCDDKVIEIKPGDNRLAWDNPYCDEVFLKFNKSIKNGKYTDKERDEMLVKALNEKKEKGEKGEKKPSDKPINIFQAMFSKPAPKQQKPSSLASIGGRTSQATQEANPSEFSIPDPDLYYSSEQKMKQI